LSIEFRKIRDIVFFAITKDLHYFLSIKKTSYLLDLSKCFIIVSCLL